ncbi:2374_t:CDS:2 [Paraglomus occultum]|uniref:Hsp90 chaperone protein kinase-targeting subunit n=1 Tax=Paraglomus occultum TaxID=144539 RepID=A0A9N8VKL2_9GLOM|nr:2374_t:CDS:2 [Paraglomus occultum]
MPIDYSKWDRLELSDDDDFECHPNVDKASLIRWKQADIHRKREERKQKITALKAEIAQNDVLLDRIGAMISQVESNGVSAFLKTVEDLRELNKKTAEQEVQQKTEGTEERMPSFDEMMAVLYEKIKAEVENESEERVGEQLVSKLKEHKEKLAARTKEAKLELEKEEAEAHKKITMDDIHTGFDNTRVSKATKATKTDSHNKSSASTNSGNAINKSASEIVTKPTKTESTSSKPASSTVTSTEQVADDDEGMIPSDLTKAFAKVKTYDESYKFISDHPEIINQEAVDSLLAEAFQAQLKKKAKYAKQCVHQGWLIQYCQKLGPDGVRLFFRRITTMEGARDVFEKDVNDTYEHICKRCEVIEKEKGNQPQVEQIQIEMTGPGNMLSVHVPDKNSDDPAEISRFETFMTLPENLREALKTGELEKINKVLGSMSVPEAEKILEICNQCEVLRVEPGIIDTTIGETIPTREMMEGNDGQDMEESQEDQMIDE